MHINMHVHKCMDAWIHTQVRLQKCRVVLEALNILEADDSQVSYILCDTLKRVVFVAGDYVIREGQEAAGMYFISSGLVEVSGGRAAATPTHSHAAPRVRCVCAACVLRVRCGLDWAAGLGCWTGLDCTALDFTVVAAH